MYLGVDLGTSSVKLLLADSKGNILDSASADYPLFFPEKDQSEQNPDDWYGALVECISALSKRHDVKAIRGVSFSGQMHGLVVLDKDDKVIRPAILWNDNRTTEECRYLNETVGKDKLLEWTGNVAFTGFTAPKLLWMRKHEPDKFAQIAKIMLPKDYLAYKMSGVFASDVSDNSGTLYFDVKNRCWSKPMLELIGISENQLPVIFDSYQPIGKVCEKFAAATGMSTDTVVVIGGGDQAVGAVGTGTVKDNTMFVSLGTSGVVFVPTAEYAVCTNGGMHMFRHANGRFHVMGCMLTSAGAMKWWVDDILNANFGKVLDEVDENAIDDLIFLPYLMGERSPINDPTAKGAFFGLTLAHKRADVTKAILEGICFGLKDCYEAVRGMGAECSVARVIGGGSRSDKWMQILSDVLGIELRRINTSDGAGLGAVILAMTGCGEFDSLQTACDALIHDTDVFRPNKERFELYKEKFGKFKELYEKTK